MQSDPMQTGEMVLGVAHLVHRLNESEINEMR